MNLTDISYLIRRYAGVAVLSLLFIFLLIYTLVLTFRLIAQKNTTPAQQKIQLNPAFGKIDLPDIPSKSLDSSPEFVLDTIEGVPITASPAATIYKYIQEKPRLSYIERSYIMAKNVGINTENARPKRDQDTIIFQDSKYRIEIKINNYNFRFSLTPDYLSQINQLLTLADEQQAVSFAIEFLSSLNKYPASLAAGKSNITYQKITPEKIEEITEKSQANALRIDFFPPDVEGLPIVTQNYTNSPNFVIVSFLKQQLTQEPEDQPNQPTPSPQEPELKILAVQAQIRHREFSEEIGVYPLITGEQAWENLKNKKAYFIHLPEAIPEKIEVKKMFIAYYYDPEKSDFLTPVFVFLGKDFIAYVPALRPDFIN